MMTPHPSPKRHTPALLLALFLAVSMLAGCLGGDDDLDTDPGQGDDGATTGDSDAAGDDSSDPDTGDGNETAGNGDDMDDMNGETDTGGECVASMTTLTTLAHDGLAIPDPTGIDPTGVDPTGIDPLTLLGATVEGTFGVDEGTLELVASASHGAYITLGWSIVLTDPDGNTHSLFESGPDADPTADADLGSKTIASPAPGTWTVTILATGYIEALQVSIDADVCA